MGLLKKILGRSEARRQEMLQMVQKEFVIFRDLLDLHNSALKLISHLEEKYHEGRLGSLSLWDEFLKIRVTINEAVEHMIELGGPKYIPLRTRLIAIYDDVEKSLPVGRPISKDDFTIPFAALAKERSSSVGTKNANLGELKSTLNLPVPDGFAISAWAYQYFLDCNRLNDWINNALKGIQIRSYQDLERVSEGIRKAVIEKPIPDELAEAIYVAFDDLAARTGKTAFALRSSAVGEDTTFSFAGQYQSFLNVRRDDLLDRYRQILASKFTPSAIYYLLRHSLSDMNLGMAAVCMEMVNAYVSGVIYTLDPLNPQKPYMVINSIYGLGSNLVNGMISPDILHITREKKEVIFAKSSSKPVRLIVNAKGEIEEVPIAEPEQSHLSLKIDAARTLAEYALIIEKHFGRPQDIEWALDESGNLFLLQARALNISAQKVGISIPANYKSTVLMEGGIPICAGIGIGPVFHLASIKDLERVPDGSIVVTQNPSPYLVTVMDRISGLVTIVGGNTSHLATLARELGVPTIVGLAQARALPENRQVTIDAGMGVIYDGSHPEWLADFAGRDSAPFDSMVDDSIKKMIYPIVHLNVIHPSDKAFTPDNCHTLHDILRFIHQKSMEEIFIVLKQTANKDKLGLRLKTNIPLTINIIYLDQNYLELKRKHWIHEDDIQSAPMKALWGGILKEGWQQAPVPPDLKGFVAVMGANIHEGHIPEFSENSYAFLSRNYMLLNLRMGYHFSTIESMVTPEPSKNYIRMQFKLGGAPLDRRIRRIWLISELLGLMGFENTNQGDFLDSSIAYQTEEGIIERLAALGRITVLTKQLDMALSSDARANWYLKEFTNKLGIAAQGDI